MLKKVRYIHEQIDKDLRDKMVLLGGPRQVGKTTLALELLTPPSPKNPAYLNLDVTEHRQLILQNQIPLQHKLIVLDEIHKYPRWRNFLKGLYDLHFETHSFLFTGSAKLDFFRKGGDSLLGRYHYFRLHPLSLFEINSTPNAKDLKLLLKLGGFPEPFLKGNETAYRRW